MAWHHMVDTMFISKQAPYSSWRHTCSPGTFNISLAILSTPTALPLRVHWRAVTVSCIDIVRFNQAAAWRICFARKKISIGVAASPRCRISWYSRSHSLDNCSMASRNSVFPCPADYCTGTGNHPSIFVVQCQDHQ